MSDQETGAKTAGAFSSRPAGAAACAPSAAPALDENVAAIRSWERSLQDERTGAERVGDWITSLFASGPVLVGHLLWFTVWIVINLGLVPAIAPFDDFPFPLLTMTVSLEAIFLALFVLASQNRLSRQADKRAHLDLQIDLLAEREMTAVLQLLQDIAAHLDVQCTYKPEQLRDLLQKTNIRELTERLDEIRAPDAAKAGESPSPEPPVAEERPAQGRHPA
jgi:uncharacterized membrane protein